MVNSQHFFNCNVPTLIANRRNLAAAATDTALHAVRGDLRPARNFYIRAVANRLVAPSSGLGARLGRISIFSRYVDGGPRREELFVALTDVDRIYGPFPLVGGFVEIDVVNEGGTNAIEYDLEIWYGDEPPGLKAPDLGRSMHTRRIPVTTDGQITPVVYFSVGTLNPQHPLVDLDRTGLDVEAIEILPTPGPFLSWKARVVAPSPNMLFALWGQAQLAAILITNSVEWYRTSATSGSPSSLNQPFEEFLAPYPIVIPTLQRVGAGNIQADYAIAWRR